VRGGGHVTELAARAALFAHAGSCTADPALWLGSDLNKSGTTN